MEALHSDKRYTYADYASWDDGVRYELIDGVPYMMSSPSWRHQGVSRELLYQFADFLRGKPCSVFAAPFDVLLKATGDDSDTVVQPDLVVVCDRSKLEDKRYNGAPDMVIEILSPSTAGHDRVVKFNKYLQAGVREYWIVDMDSQSVSVHVLENGKYVTSAYAGTDTVPVRVLDGCTIRLPEVFAE